MDSSEVKAILQALVTDVELQRAHSQYLTSVLEQAGIRASLAEAQDGMSLAMQSQQKRYDALRKRIEDLA